MPSIISSSHSTPSSKFSSSHTHTHTQAYYFCVGWGLLIAKLMRASDRTIHLAACYRSNRSIYPHYQSSARQSIVGSCVIVGQDWLLHNLKLSSSGWRQWILSPVIQSFYIHALLSAREKSRKSERETKTCLLSLSLFGLYLSRVHFLTSIQPVQISYFRPASSAAGRL